MSQLSLSLEFELPARGFRAGMGDLPGHPLGLGSLCCLVLLPNASLVLYPIVTWFVRLFARLLKS